ncbi:MAG: SAM-dependent chlorinase/fluorinase [Lachnospiraceae bacterium]|nr:SAM-dependent chlorinase/fluorinase [Lachnospiraceae bacterium]
MKPAILLQTDFSTTWSAVAQMKGVIKIVDPTLEIYDLCHEIKNFDPWEASLSLDATEPYWPKGTVIVSVVDPGVGTSRRASVALLCDGTYVVTPDNGSLTHLKYSVGIAEIREIDEAKNRYQAREEVSVFHGRDLFGYCAALLASSKISFAEVGPAYPVNEIVECPEYHFKPQISGTSVDTWVMTGLSHFGGIQFGIKNDAFKALGYTEGDPVHVCISHKGDVVFDQIVPFAKSFGFVPEGAPVLYCGSSLFVSLDVNCGNFMQVYGVGFGKDWTVHLEKCS